VVLTQALPFFFLSGFLMTPDAPLAAAWAASLFYLERALVAGDRRAWWRVGLALGLGAISKYSIGLLVPVALIFMLWDRNSRRWWLRYEPYLAALLAIAVFSPVILWNVQHEWASFAFQTSRRLAENPRFALHKLIASSIVLITPTGVLAVVAAFMSAKPGAAGGDCSGTRQRRFVGAAILLPLAVFALFSLRHEVKLDWTGAPWIAALPVIAAAMIAADTSLSGLRAWVRAAWNPTFTLLLLLYGAGLHYLVLGLPGFGYGNHPELIPVGWRDLSRRVAATAEASHRDSGNAPLIVGMDRYAIASELAFYSVERSNIALETSSAHLLGGVGLMYERWTPPALQEGRTLLLIAWDPRELAGDDIASHCERLGPIEDGVVTRDGQVVRHYYHRLAYNYRSLPRP
jgi:dolichol-phosphate mannosyltransferase